ncbi:hypothetical protein CJJ09_000028 [Candidozyma auris]|nr:hypothetical protein CJJ09_000028 [[Candida] auris]
MEDDTLYNQPVVLDNGSGNLKAGFAGKKTKIHEPALVGRPKYQKIMAVSSADDSVSKYNNIEAYVGRSARQNRGLLKLSYPIEHGVVNDWEDMERLWHYVFTKELKTAPEEHPLLITEAPLNPRANRDHMCQIMFETFNIPSIKRMDVGGRDITDYLAMQIRQMSGITLSSSSELDIARQIKEQCCYVSKDPQRDEKLYSGVVYSHFMGSSAPGAYTHDGMDLFSSYKLPDGHTLHLGLEQFRAPEILFNPQLIGDESPGIDELMSIAIAKTDLDLRPTLYQNIILSGGTTFYEASATVYSNNSRSRRQAKAAYGQPTEM